MTAVHEATLNDLVYPAEIVGKRIRVKLDGSKQMKVHLDKTQQTTVEHKVNYFQFAKNIFLVCFTEIYSSHVFFFFSVIPTQFLSKSFR